MDDSAFFDLLISKLRKATLGMTKPAISRVVFRFGKNPFLILMSCLLSLRTKDIVSLPASFRLFDCATTPQGMIALSLSTIETIIYPVGFYRRKAALIHTISKDLCNRFNGCVPNTKEDLLSLSGVGIKTANLVLGEGFGIPAICVDTHVHRISNRLGIVKTKTPEETEKALSLILPKKYWIEYNRLLVMFGQNSCVPISPWCSTCPLKKLCPQVGVLRSR